MRKSFTLIELSITVVIIGILCTFALVGYVNAIQNAKARACQSNLAIILGAVEAYIYEYDQAPTNLATLKDKHFQIAWEQFLKRKDAWKDKLAYFIVNLNRKGLAYAANPAFEIKNYTSDLYVLDCPADPTPGDVSYSLSGGIASISRDAYEALPDDTIIVADNESWHKLYRLGATQAYAIGIQKNKILVKN